jgi:outer membrane biosynthesis protein TonB
MITKLALLLTLATPEKATTDSIRADREIRLVALRHVADVRRCYEREGLTRDPRLSGTLDVTVTVLATGVVSEVAVTAADMRGIGAREVSRCLTTAMRNWRFDRGPYEVETIVFPFSFQPEPGGSVKVVSS